MTLSGSPNGTNSGKGFKARFASSLEQARKAGRSDEEIYVYAHERFADGVGSGWELLLKEEEMLRALIDDGRLIMGMPHLYKPRPSFQSLSPRETITYVWFRRRPY